MSLNTWILGKEKEEITLEKIKEEIRKAFLTKKGTEFKHKKRFWIEDFIKIVAKNLNMKEDVVRKHIETLLVECFIFKCHRGHIYYNYDLSDRIRDLNIVLDGKYRYRCSGLRVERIFGVREEYWKELNKIEKIIEEEKGYLRDLNRIEKNNN